MSGNSYASKPAKAIAMSERILAMLERGAKLTTLQIAERVGKRTSSMNEVLNRMLAAGTIEHCGAELHGVSVWRKAGR